jgi:hypothetical protein
MAVKCPPESFDSALRSVALLDLTGAEAVGNAPGIIGGTWQMKDRILDAMFCKVRCE